MIQTEIKAPFKYQVKADEFHGPLISALPGRGFAMFVMFV